MSGRTTAIEAPAEGSTPSGHARGALASVDFGVRGLGGTPCTAPPCGPATEVTSRTILPSCSFSSHVTSTCSPWQRPTRPSAFGIRWPCRREKSSIASEPSVGVSV